MKKIKVVILHNIITPHIIPLFERLGKEKTLELKVFFASENEENRLWKEEVVDKFDYKILPKITIELKGKDLFTYFINPTVFFELIRNHPEVVIVAGWDLFAYQVAFFYAKLFRKKFILWSGSTKYEESWRRTIALPLVKLMVWRTDAYLAYGTRAKEYLISLGAKPEKIFIAHHSIDVETFEKELTKWKKLKEKIKEKIGIKKGRVILFVGQLIERKGVVYLIKGFERLKEEIHDVNLLIIGYGQQEEKLRELVRKEHLEDIFWVGGADWPGVAKFYAVADLFVLPSVEEIWGLVINEAMTAELPIITTNRVGASIDLLKDGRNGAVVKSGNSHDLFLAMKKILEDNKLITKMGQKSSNFIKDFGIDNQMEGILEAINDVSK